MRPVVYITAFVFLLATIRFIGILRRMQMPKSYKVMAVVMYLLCVGGFAVTIMFGNKV